MQKLDLRKKLKAFYTASAGKPAFVEVPRLNFLMADGSGDPNKSPDFARTVEALYGLSYTLKFSFRKSPDPIDYPVLPLEGLWRFGSPLETNPPDLESLKALLQDKNDWIWTLMIAQPDFISLERLERARADLKKKKDSPALDLVRLEQFDEGPSAQILHVGPYSEELPTVEKLFNFVHEQGYRFRGMHHEIYLGDPRRTAPERLKTILRHPVTRD